MPEPGVTLGASDWFFLSRIDGRTNIHTLGQMTGLSDEAAVATVRRLVEAGLVAVSGLESPPQRPTTTSTVSPLPAPPTAPPAAQPSRPPSSPRTRPVPAVGADPDRPPTSPDRRQELPAEKRPDPAAFGPDITERGWPIPFLQFPYDPHELGDGAELTEHQKRVILYFHHHLRRVTYYALFNVPQTADAAVIRTAYFSLSKAFHPDRWFRKDVGAYRERIEDIFKWVNRANGVLSNVQKRRGYDNLMRQGYIGEWQLEERGRTDGARPAEAGPAVSADVQRRTATVFRARAKQAESSGQWQQAIDQYQRALQLDDTTELRILLVECMLRAQRPATEIDAELERAKRAAPADLRLMVLEAENARRQGAIPRAAQLYKDVLKLDPANPAARLGIEKLRGPG